MKHNPKIGKSSGALPAIGPGAPKPQINFRDYQKPVFANRSAGILILHWSRQIGKSHVLSAWAVDRLLSRPGRLVTVLSNSRANGGEFVQKCREHTEKMGGIMRKLNASVETAEMSPDLTYDNMRMEVRITLPNDDGALVTGRIIVLAANPRTARGFSGDLILDEFAFHENSMAIWEAAEPILSSNSDFVCRIASTGNGKHNMFYRMCSGEGPNDGTLFKSASGFDVSRVTRTEAWKMGVKVWDPQTRLAITPDEAREKSLDKAAYDQNYECLFADENMTLLTHELISAAETPNCGIICKQDWTPAALELMRRAEGRLHVGVDVGRKVDLTVISVLETIGSTHFLRAMLRIQNMRLPDQQLRLGEVCRMPKFVRAALDMTGIGLGLFEYSQNEFGMHRIQGINFGTSVPATRAILATGSKQAMVRVTEALAMQLLQAYEDKRIKHPADNQLRDSLRKPERIVTAGGRVSIAAVRDEAGHADDFWSLALALEAASVPVANFSATVI